MTILKEKPTADRTFPIEEIGSRLVDAHNLVANLALAWMSDDDHFDVYWRQGGDSGYGFMLRDDRIANDDVFHEYEIHMSPEFVDECPPTACVIGYWVTESKCLKGTYVWGVGVEQQRFRCDTPEGAISMLKGLMKSRMESLSR